MFRELRKHFFEKSLRICKCAGRLTCSGRNALESNLIPALGARTPGTVLKHVLRADANLVALLCRALIWGGRSQGSGLTQFPIRLSERSGNRTPLAELT